MAVVNPQEFLTANQFSCDDRRDAIRNDPECTARRLCLVAIEFNTHLVQALGGRLGPTRGLKLIDQAISAAFQTVDGQDIHSSDFAKAAMIFRGITAGHPFEDGNKRTGFMLAAYYLNATGHPLPPKIDVGHAEKLCLSVSAGQMRDIVEIEKGLRNIWQNKD